MDPVFLNRNVNEGFSGALRALPAVAQLPGAASACCLPRYLVPLLPAEPRSAWRRRATLRAALLFGGPTTAVVIQPPVRCWAARGSAVGPLHLPIICTALCCRRREEAQRDPAAGVPGGRHGHPGRD